MTPEGETLWVGWKDIHQAECSSDGVPTGSCPGRRCDVLYFSSPQTLVSQFGQPFNKEVNYTTTGRPILGSFSGHLTIIDEADANAGWVVPAGFMIDLVDRLELIKKEPSSEFNRRGENGFEWTIKTRPYERLANEYLKFLHQLRFASNEGRVQL